MNGNETKRPGDPKQKIINGRRSKNKIDATTDTTKRNFNRSKYHKLHLTRPRYFKLLFLSKAAAIDFAPSPPIRLSRCTAHVSLHLTRSKEKSIFSRSKNPKLLHLTRPSISKLLLPSKAAAIDFAPTSPIWLPRCTAHVSLHLTRSKEKS